MKYTLFILLWLAGQCALGQSIVKGVVKDAESKRVLAGCSIKSVTDSLEYSTGSSGEFSIPIRQRECFIFSYTGYRPDTVCIDANTLWKEITLVETSQMLNEVIIRGATKANRILENPIVLSAVSLKSIDRANENNIIDVLSKSTAGMNVLKTGPNISKPFIRGMGFNRVLTLYDGVRQEGQQWGGEHGLEIDNYNIERAEIIKGPASLVYGADALAGVVSLFPYVPKETDGKIDGRWISEYQSNNGLVGNGFRLSSGGNHWLWVVRGAYRLAKNYTNATDGRVFNTGFQEKNISALLGYKSTSGFTHLNASLYDNLQGIPDGSRDSLTRKFTKQIFEGADDDIKNRPIVSNAELNSYSLNPLHQRIQHYRLYANNHYHFDAGDVNFLIAFTQNIRREFNHPTAVEQAGTYLRLNTVNYSVRYNVRQIGHLETSIGVNGMFQNNKIKEATNFPVPDYNLTDFGAFAVATWQKESWTIVGGARFDARTIQTYKFYSRTDPQTGFDIPVVGADTVGATLQFPSLHQSFRGMSLSLGSTYKLNDIFNLKINFSRGYRAPSISEIASNGLDAGAHILYIGNPDFVPEFSWQEDLGLFADFAQLSASLSLFNKNIQNYIYLNQVTNAQGLPVTDAQGNKTFQYQQSSAQLYGLEATLAWKPNSIRGFSFNNQLAVCYGFNRNPLFSNKKTLGEYLPFIPPPRWVSSLMEEFDIHSKKISAMHASVEMDFNAAQHNYMALYDTETPTPGYALFNIAAGATFGQSQKSNWQVQLQVNNVFDAVYQSNMSRLKYFEYYQQSPNGRYGIYGMGRNVCIKFIFSF